MDAKTFSLVAGIIFGVVALFHLVRIFAEWTLIIGDWSVPKSVSWVALIVAGGAASPDQELSQRWRVHAALPSGTCNANIGPNASAVF